MQRQCDRSHRKSKRFVQGLNQVGAIDGIWLDMNEIISYCSGDVCIDPGGQSMHTLGIYHRSQGTYHCCNNLLSLLWGGDLHQYYGRSCYTAGNVRANNDFQCHLTCQWGPNAFSDEIKGPRKEVPLGIFEPPFRINNENTQVGIFWTVAEAGRSAVTSIMRIWTVCFCIQSIIYQSRMVPLPGKEKW